MQTPKREPRLCHAVTISRRLLLGMVLTVLAALAFSMPALVAWPSEPRVGESPRPLALVGGTVFRSPEAAPINDGLVLIRNGRIAAVGRPDAIKVPADVERLDCSGMSILSGFWNSHVHFGELKWAGAAGLAPGRLEAQLTEMLTRYGFTSVFDTGSWLENTLAIRRRVESGEIAGPRILTTGGILFPPGGAPPPAMLQKEGFILEGMFAPASAEQAVAIVDRELDGGADAVKVYSATWFGAPVSMPPPILRAAVAEAHRRGKLALAHPSSLVGLRNAVEAGVDIIVHTAPEAGPWSPELITRMLERKVSLIPTLKLWKYELSRQNASADAVERFVGTGIEQLRAYRSAGGEVLFGTDVGYMHDYDPTDEYALLSRSGLDWRAILAALTTSPAKRLGFAERSGRIDPGRDADVVILAADPSADAAALAKVRYVIRGGRLVFRSVAK